MPYYKKFIKTDSFDKVFQVYDLTSKTATIKNDLESVNDDTIIFITDISIGNYIYAKGSLWSGDDSSNGGSGIDSSINWVVLQDDEEFKYNDKMLFQNNLILYDSSTVVIPRDTTKLNTQYVEDKVISGNSRIMRFDNELTTISDSSSDKTLFTCTNVNQLYLPESLTYIGSYAFSSLKNITIPNNVTQLKANCFNVSTTKHITISKLHSSYTSKIFTADCSVRFLSVDEHAFDESYNVDVMFTRGSGSGSKVTKYTYQVYADDPTLVAQLQNINDENTIVKVHSLHDWKN